MSWIPDKHRKLYTAAASAMYIDLKTATKNIVEKTSDLIATGYEKIKDKYNNNNVSTNNINSDNLSDDNIDIDISENISNEYNDDPIVIFTNNQIRSRPDSDVLIKINKKHKNITKIWSIDSNGIKTQIKGKISSYEHINNIIHEWFVYENKIQSDSEEDKIRTSSNSREYKTSWKWYPTLELYTKYRELSNGVLQQIDMILFKQRNGKYLPFPPNKSKSM